MTQDQIHLIKSLAAQLRRAAAGDPHVDFGYWITEAENEVEKYTIKPGNTFDCARGFSKEDK